MRKQISMLALFTITLPHEYLERIPKDSPLLFSAGLVDPTEEYLTQHKKRFPRLREHKDSIRNLLELLTKGYQF